ncbi:MAG: hypothetical protein KC731_21630, partial [Myxococcales bacterium]|nr:hypothetical protein [Myxococcales bacterium]
PRGGGAAPPSSSRGVDSVAEGQEGVGHGRIVASEGVGFDPAAPRGGGPMEPLPKPKPRTRPNIRATLKKK